MASNIYEIVTNRIIEQLEKSIVPWRKTWHGSEPINYVTRKKYRGINLLLLPYGGEWLTFKQALDCGGNVKRGEKGSMIVFYKMIEREDEDGEKELIPYLHYSNVFHLSQCENIESKLEQLKFNQDTEPIEAAQKVLDDYINRSGVILKHIQGSNKSVYYPGSDTIVLPVVGQFESIEEYYCVGYHEAAHSTGHKSRLNRITGTAAFGSGDYSREELIAEISACMLMNAAGIEVPEVLQNSASYIKSWITMLKADVKAVITASGKAQKATDLILGVAE